MTSALAFTFIREDLALSVPDWPQEMCLALCLEEKGGHAILLYHQDEATDVGSRIETVFGCDRSMIALSPTMLGFPKPKVRFAEERMLLEFINPELAEDARTYAMNMRYAIEEGLDVDQFMSTSRAPVVKVDANNPAGRDAQEMHGISPAPVSPDNEPINPAGRAAPRGYFALTAEDCRSCEATTGHMLLLPSGDVAIIPECVSLDDVRMPHDRLFIREDLGGLALDVTHMFRGIERRILIKKGMIPAPILRDLEVGALPIRVSRTGNIMHIHLEQHGNDVHATTVRLLKAIDQDFTLTSPTSAPAPEVSPPIAKAGRSNFSMRRLQVVLVALLSILTLPMIGLFDHGLNAAVATEETPTKFSHEATAAGLARTLTGVSVRVNPVTAFRLAVDGH